MADLHSEAADSLFKAILSLRSEEECYAFFEDLCTVGELQAMSQKKNFGCLPTMAAFACEGRCGVFMTVSPRKIAKRFAYMRKM